MVTYLHILIKIYFEISDVSHFYNFQFRAFFDYRPQVIRAVVFSDFSLFSNAARLICRELRRVLRLSLTLIFERSCSRIRSGGTWPFRVRIWQILNSRVSGGFRAFRFVLVS